MVCPSGAARATYSAAMAPLAPALFSTITVRPSSADIFCATTRAMPSLPPPAAVGTTSVMGRSGKAACAPAGKARAPGGGGRGNARAGGRRRRGGGRGGGGGGGGGGGARRQAGRARGRAGPGKARAGAPGVAGSMGWGWGWVGAFAVSFHVLIGGATAGHRRGVGPGVAGPLALS